MSFIKKCNRCNKNERHVAKEKTGDKGDYCLGCKRVNKPDKKIKKKKIKIIITQQMCDELNAIRDKCFTKEQQELLGMRENKPHTVEALYG